MQDPEFFGNNKISLILNLLQNQNDLDQLDFTFGEDDDDHNRSSSRLAENPYIFFLQSYHSKPRRDSISPPIAILSSVACGDD
jgi:hypothetical protein